MPTNVDSVRIVIVEMSPLVSKLFRTLADDAADLAVVATVADADELVERLVDTAPDVVVWGVAGPALADRALPVLRRRPDLPIVGLGEAGRAAAVCTLRPSLQQLEAPSGESLVALVRRLGRELA